MKKDAMGEACDTHKEGKNFIEAFGRKVTVQKIQQ